MSKNLSIGLDIDGVLCNFQRGMIQRAKERDIDFYDHWTQWRGWDTDYPENFKVLFESVKDDWEFWYNLPPYEHASRYEKVVGEVKFKKGWLPFKPEVYVSHRNYAPDGVTKGWLDGYEFPEAPVHIVEENGDKLEHIRGCDLFIDDRIDTVRKIMEAWERNNDVPVPILFSMPWNVPTSDDDASDIMHRAYQLTDITQTDSITELIQW